MFIFVQRPSRQPLLELIRILGLGTRLRYASRGDVAFGRDAVGDGLWCEELGSTVLVAAGPGRVPANVVDGRILALGEGIGTAALSASGVDTGDTVHVRVVLTWVLGVLGVDLGLGATLAEVVIKVLTASLACWAR